jgi:hypothetical protein
MRGRTAAEAKVVPQTLAYQAVLHDHWKTAEKPVHRFNGPGAGMINALSRRTANVGHIKGMIKGKRTVEVEV